MRVIRPLLPDDAEELTALLVANREAFAPVMPDRPDGYYTAVFQRPAGRARRGGRLAFAILDGEDIAGSVNVSDVVRGPVQLANLGYWVDRSRHGRGLATAAVGAVVTVAFGEGGLHRLEAGTLPENVASQRVLERNGFTRYGVARGLIRIAGEWRDHVLFERLAAD